MTSDTLRTDGGDEVASITYGYDANDNLTSKTLAGFAGSGTNTYTYDRADRLASWDDGARSVGYSYDASGNLVQSGSTSYTYDERNELLSDGTRSFAYTARGTLSLISSAGEQAQAAAFDAFGQAVDQGGRSYGYDALGRVVAVSGASGGSYAMAYSGSGNTLASDGVVQYSRTPGDGLFAVGVGSGSGVLAWTDLHDDVVAQFGAAGESLSGSSVYDPFGTVTATVGMRGGLGYQSGWTDPGTDRVNMGTRWYDPGQSRFVSHDSVRVSPVPASGAANAFAYADGNPLTVTDPDGTFGIPKIISRAASWVGRTVSKTANAITATVAKGFAAVKSTAGKLYSAAKSGVKSLGRQVVRAAKPAVRTVSKKVADAKAKVTKVLPAVKQATTRAVKTAVTKASSSVKSVNTAYEKSVADARKKVAATDEFLKHHAGATSATVTAAVFVGGEAAFTSGVYSGEGQFVDAAAKSHWWDDAGDFLADAAAETVNAFASLGNAMWHHPGDFFMIAAGVVLLNASGTVEAGAVVLVVLPGGAVAAVPVEAVAVWMIAAGAGFNAA